jgi:protein-S-isoprenylcysteine O-methyltransferase Ste14
MISRFRVFFGFLAGGLFAWMCHPAPVPRLLLGLAVALAGLLLRGWAAGYLEKGKRLAQDGPYALFRHPLYDGSFLIALGFVIAGTHRAYEIHLAFVAAAFLALFVVVYPLRIRDEEVALEGIFGDGWRAFVARNHRFLPSFPPFRRDNPDSFSWERYRKNREYQAALGYLAGVGVLAFKLRG